MPHYRKDPSGRSYRQCEASVPESPESSDTRLCRKAAAKGDRLCAYHRRLRQAVNQNRRQQYVVTLSKKGTRPVLRKGHLFWPKFVIGKVFNSYEDAKLYTRLNSTLIFAIPGVKSYCIEPYKRVFK